MRIERTKYLQELIDRKHNGLVKVITGIRRCGKSYLLFTLFYDHLIAEGVKKENIIKLELDQTANIKYYIQSAFEMRSPDKEYQEIRPYTAIEDSFKKIVVTKDHIKLKRDENGIVTMSIYDFLLKPDSLDL